LKIIYPPIAIKSQLSHYSTQTNTPVKLWELGIERMLSNDPDIGEARSTNAGYDIAKKVAQKRWVKIPMK
jgi:hypothetical protein